jgi:4-amino-4-deoxy-L-arabinose transferase-like glycosyltransferase
MEAGLKKNLKLWLTVVVVVAVVIRLVLFVTYPEVSYSDTASYRRSANAILAGMTDYDGTRTPGYPAFLALLGPDRMVYAVQLVLGFCITLAWFYMGWKLSSRPFFGALAGLAHTLNPGQFFFEANLLTETLATFLLVLALAGAMIWLEYPRRRTIWLGLGIGLIASLAALVRPLFIYMPVWLAIVLACTFKEKKLKVDWRPLVTILAVALVLIGGWMRWVKNRFNMFSLTTMTGYHLVQHTGHYFEDVPDEYADIRDIYIEYRDARIAERGSQGNTIWDAIPAIVEATDYGFIPLSQVMQKISIQLILTHPWQYLAHVLKGWWYFWRAPVYWDVSAVSSTTLAKVLEILILAARGLLFGANMVFILSSVGVLFSKRLRELWSICPFHWLLAGSVWAASAASSLMDHGDNPRFLVPLQTLVVFWVIWLGWTSWRAWHVKQLNQQNREGAA